MSNWNKCLIAGVLAGLGMASGTAVSAPITYQGALEDMGNPADGMYDMAFTLADSEVFGLALQLITIDDVAVVDGLFEVELDFDDVHFNGSDRWLSIRVNGTSLSPRSKINYTPYAVRARSAQRAGIANSLEVPWVVVTDTDVVDATSLRGVAVSGHSNNSSGTNPGVYGVTDSRSSNAAGVHGEVSSNEPGSFSAGVRGENNGTGFSGVGVYGLHAGTGFGVYGRSPGGFGTLGSSDSGFGLYGISDTGTGLFAFTDSGAQGGSFEHGDSGTTASLATASYGVQGVNTDEQGEGTGIYGEGGRIGVRGVALPDGFGSDLTRIGVDGFAGGFSTGANMIYGVRGFAQNPANGGSRTAYGVYGGAQVGNSANTAYGVYGESVGPGGTQYAGYFQGNVHVAGTLSKSSGSFKIDHPMDPENKYLSHSFVESPEMLNVYSGIVTLDDTGRAVVELPHYFDSLNTDYRYQLTAIGAAMPSLHVAEVIDGNVFVVGGGVALKQVSWQVTGVRIDASATYRPIVVEEDKAPGHRGLYLDPEAHGFGNDRAIHRSGSHERTMN